MARCVVKLADDITVMIQPQPRHPLKNRLGRLGCVAQPVGILDPEKKFPTTPARVKPVEKRRACPANVQIAGRRWGEAGDDRRCHKSDGPFNGNVG